MSKPETIKIDDVEYVRSDATPDTKGDVKIVIVDRGFVYVGRVDYIVIANSYVITNAKNIRKWGTTRGLGELVNGPLAETVLDQVGTVRIPERAVISIIDVVGAKWKGI